MNRIDEINARLSAIAAELETATGEALTDLETEVNDLTAERTALENEIQSRQALRSRIAAGQQPGVQVQTPAATAAQPRAESVEEKEIRSFAGYVRGLVTEMRTNEQNFNVANNTALIPATIARKVIDKVVELCPILRGADVYHVKGTLKIPVYGPKTVSGTDHNITVAYGADFSELTADAGAFTSVDLTGYLLGVLTLIGRTLLNSTDLDLTNFIVNKLAEQIAIFVEGELLTGTGATYNHCTGALSSTNTLNAGSTSAITADKLIDLQSQVPQAYQANACWTMHPTTFAAVKKLKDGDGRYLLQTGGGVLNAFPYTLLGKPVYVSDNMPTIASAAKAVLYGDYSGLAVNIREDVSIEILREKYATQHAIGIVGWMELDSKIEDASKLAVLVMSA